MILAYGSTAGRQSIVNNPRNNRYPFGAYLETVGDIDVEEVFVNTDGSDRLVIHGIRSSLARYA